MASLQIGLASTNVGLARARIVHRSTCLGRRYISLLSPSFSSPPFFKFPSSPPSPSTTATLFSSSFAPRRATRRLIPQRLLGRRSYSQQQDQESNGPGADSSKVQGSKFRWYPIPVGLGVGFLGLVQFYKVYTREKEKDGEIERPRKRRRIRPDGPWYEEPSSLSPSRSGLALVLTGV
jgi:phosphatidylserine decarboxylase